MIALPDEEFHAELEKRFGLHLGDLKVAGPRKTFPLGLFTAREFIAERIALVIDGSDSTGRVITASLAGERRELTDGALLASFAAFPLLTLKVVAGIHWEALKLWIKGMRLRPRPPAPQAITIVPRPLLRSSEVHGAPHV